MAMSARPTPIIVPIQPVIHGSNSDSDTATVRQATDELKFNSDHPLYNDLAPSDSYLDGVYWVSQVAEAVIIGQ